jgi:hypothetical protein
MEWTRSSCDFELLLYWLLALLPMVCCCVLILVCFVATLSTLVLPLPLSTPTPNYISISALPHPLLLYRVSIHCWLYVHSKYIVSLIKLAAVSISHALVCLYLHSFLVAFCWIILGSSRSRSPLPPYIRSLILVLAAHLDLMWISLCCLLKALFLVLIAETDCLPHFHLNLIPGSPSLSISASTVNNIVHRSANLRISTFVDSSLLCRILISRPPQEHVATAVNNYSSCVDCWFPLARLCSIVEVSFELIDGLCRFDCYDFVDMNFSSSSCWSGFSY